MKYSYKFFSMRKRLPPSIQLYVSTYRRRPFHKYRSTFLNSSRRYVNFDEHNDFHQKPNTLAFIDWDGCISDSFPSIEKKMNLTYHAFIARNSEISEEDKNIIKGKLSRRHTKVLKEHMAEVFGKEYSEEACQLYHALRNDSTIPPKKLVNGAKEFLLDLKKLNIPFVILSNAPKIWIEQEIITLNLTHIMENVLVVGSDEVAPNNKPNVEHALFALKKFNIEKHDNVRIIFIGDGFSTDMLCAAELSCYVGEGSSVDAYWITKCFKDEDKPNFELSVASSFKKIIYGIQPVKDRIYDSLFGKFNHQSNNNTTQINEHNETNRHKITTPTQ